MMTLVLVMMLAAGSVAGGDLAEQPNPTKALAPAITAAIDKFNAGEEKLRTNPRVETTGPEAEPQMLRATYRRAGGGYQVTSMEAGDAPTATVRVRAIELEKRATNVDGDVRGSFAKAEWKETPRGWVLDFRLRWTGKEWEQIGEPAEFPTLGVAGQ